MAYLTIRIKGTEGYTRVALGKERMVVGRASATDVPVKHTSISREHCAFVREGAEWFVEDLGSSNSTWVGKVKVAGRQAVKERDIVKLGHARLTFHAGELSEPEAAVEVNSEDDDGVPTETRQRAPLDPPEAITCSACGGWFSIAHRLAGDSMPCPRCGHSCKIPVLA
jgi:pSer/pThr/pTyr-binding forkhead associated (FHA) protein